MISGNQTLTFDYIKQNYQKLVSYEILANPAFDFANPEILDYFENVIIHNMNGFDWDGVSRNRTLTPEFVEKYQDKLQWRLLSSYFDFSKNNKGNFFKKYSDKWIKYDLPFNIYLDKEFIAAHIETLDVRKLLVNPALTMGVIEKLQEPSLNALAFILP